MRCKTHRNTSCTDAKCRREREAASSPRSSSYDAMADPTSPLHQATYGGAYYGSSDSGSSSCDTSSSSSSSSDSGGSCGGGE